METDVVMPETKHPEILEEFVIGEDLGAPHGLSAGQLAALVRAIDNMEQSIEDDRQYSAEAAEYYRQRIEKKKEGIEYLKSMLQTTLKIRGKSSIPTPNGVIINSTRTVRHWPDDNTLLKWAQEMETHYGLPLITRKEFPNKTALKEFIQTNGVTPGGYHESEEESVSIRRSKNSTLENND